MILILKSAIVISLLFIMGGCSGNEHSLTSSKKARLVKELVVDNAQCSSFRVKLIAPSIDDSEIEKIYVDAMKARCINKDI